MVDEGVVVHRHLGHGVGQVNGIFGSGVRLHDASLAALPRHDEHPGVRHGVGPTAGGDVGDVERRVQDGARANEDDDPVGRKGLIELCENGHTIAEDSPEMGLQDGGIAGQEVGQAVDLQAAVALLGSRRCARVLDASVHQDDLRRHGAQRRSSDRCTRRLGGHPTSARDGPNGRLAPGLVARPRKARLYEAPEGRGPALPKPVGLGAGHPDKALEALPIGVLLLGHGAHGRAPVAAGSFSSQE